MKPSSIEKNIPTHRAVIPVVFQIFLFVLPFLLAGGVFLRWQSQKVFEEERLEFGKTLLMEASAIEAAQLEAEKFGRAKTDAAYFQARIEHIASRFGTETKEQNIESTYRTDLRYGYFAVENKEIYPILDRGSACEQEEEWIKQCAAAREGICASYTKEEEHYLAVYTPVFSSAGQVLGVVKCSLETGKFFMRSKEMAQRISRPAMYSFLVILLAMMLMLMIFLHPVRQLKFFLQEVGEQGKPKVLCGRGQNEISELLEILSRMSENIHEYRLAVSSLQERYRAFVPMELVHLLGKEDIREIHAGDAALCEGTLAVIRRGDFAGLQANFPAEEMIEEINLGMEQMIPEIEENHGEILRFFQGGLMVLFPGKGGEAVTCIGRVLQKLQEKTQTTYYAALDYQKISLELAGDDSRLQFTLRGKDWEDLQSLAQLAQTHGLVMVGGGGIARKLKEENSLLPLRFLGQVIKRGEGDKEKTLELIAFAAEKKERDILLFQETSPLFAQGLHAYYLGHFRESREYFAEIVRKNSEDRAAQRYFILCDQHLWGEKKEEPLCFDWLG